MEIKRKPLTAGLKANSPSLLPWDEIMKGESVICVSLAVFNLNTLRVYAYNFGKRNNCKIAVDVKKAENNTCELYLKNTKPMDRTTPASEGFWVKKLPIVRQTIYTLWANFLKSYGWNASAVFDQGDCILIVKIRDIALRCVIAECQPFSEKESYLSRTFATKDEMRQDLLDYCIAAGYGNPERARYEIKSQTTPAGFETQTLIYPATDQESEAEGGSDMSEDGSELQ